MNKSVFKIISIILFAIDALIGLYLLTSVILALTGVILLGNIQLIFFIVLLGLNICYLIYIIVLLIIDKIRSNR